MTLAIPHPPPPPRPPRSAAASFRLRSRLGCLPSPHRPARHHHGPGSGAEKPGAHRNRRENHGLHPCAAPLLRPLRPQRRQHRSRRARPPPLLLRRDTSPCESRGVPPQRGHSDARRPAGIGRVLLQRAPQQRGLHRDQRLLCRRGCSRGGNRG